MARKWNGKCILCLEVLPKQTKPEHILLNALGGRMTVSNIVCPSCNHAMGFGPDRDLADSTKFIRNICEMSAGDGDRAPGIYGLEADGLRIDLLPGKGVRARSPRPLSISTEGDEIKVHINAHSNEEAERLVLAAAAKIAKSLGHNSVEAIGAIAKDILRDRQNSYGPPPIIQGNIQFGQGASQRAMAKACLVLWAKYCGTSEVTSSGYDPIRRYIKDGDESLLDECQVKIDTRPLPKTPEDFGSNPNIVWAGSDGNGRVYGYFRLYGAIGWRISLCDESYSAAWQGCLISNPLNNREWDMLEGTACPIQYEWVSAERGPPDYDQVKLSLSCLSKYAHELARDRWLLTLIEEGLKKAGCKEGDLITEEHIRVLTQHMAPALTASILRSNVPEDR